MSMKSTSLLAASAFALVAAGCAGPAHEDEAGAPESQPPQATSEAPSAPPAQAAPAASNGAAAAPPSGVGGDFAPVSSRGSRVAEEPGANAASAAGITFDYPQGWEAETPNSSMRMAQARIPGEAGDGQLTAFFFGVGGGGGLEANVQRWLGQMVLDPGTEPARESFETAGFRVTWIDVSGTLKASTMGTGPTADQPGSRLFGAMVEGEGGPWYFKATGPEATLAANREAFLELLRSIRR